MLYKYIIYVLHYKIYVSLTKTSINFIVLSLGCYTSLGPCTELNRWYLLESIKSKLNSFLTRKAMRMKHFALKKLIWPDQYICIYMKRITSDLKCGYATRHVTWCIICFLFDTPLSKAWHWKKYALTIAYSAH